MYTSYQIFGLFKTDKQRMKIFLLVFSLIIIAIFKITFYKNLKKMKKKNQVIGDEVRTPNRCINLEFLYSSLSQQIKK